jgi:hypothetical protein
MDPVTKNVTGKKTKRKKKRHKKQTKAQKKTLTNLTDRHIGYPPLGSIA